jgi:hypothetical protein
MLNPSIVSALAALAGAAIGGFMSAVASWLAQQREARTQWFTHERLRREALYTEFIEEAAKCYIDALQHDAAKADIPSLVVLYSKIDRMRILSTPKVIACAEQVGGKILDTYLEPDRSFLELREMVNNKSLHLLRDFSEVCREEFDTLRAKQF